MHAEATQTVVPFKYSGKINELPSAELVRKMFDYDPETGIFAWRWHPRLHSPVSHPTGRKSGGYLKIGVLGSYYLAHRLIWVHHYGSSPNGIIDHINGDPLDNRISNLRLSNFSQNSQNSKIFISNSSGFRNVSKGKNKWLAQISYKNVLHHLGSFESPEMAWEAVKAKRIEFGMPIEFRPNDKKPQPPELATGA